MRHRKKSFEAQKTEKERNLCEAKMPTAIIESYLSFLAVLLSPHFASSCAMLNSLETESQLTIQHTHTHTLILSQTHTLFYSQSLSFSLFLTHKLALAHKHTFSLMHTHIYSLSLSHTHTHSHFERGVFFERIREEVMALEKI